MDILSYLSELIQTRKAIGISGLGTVFKKKIPGKYDAETHSFIPPSYTLDFTDEIKEDSLLAAFIGKKRNVSNDTAMYFINEFSADTLRQLNSDGTFSFGELGKLVRSADKISFEPAESINYGFDFYGLPAVKDEQEQLPEAISEIEDVQEAAFLPAEETSHLVAEETAPEEKEELVSQPGQEPDLSEESPSEEPTIESVVADNESSEENPGDEETSRIQETETEEVVAPATVTDTPVTETVPPVIETVVPDGTMADQDSEEKPSETQVNPFAQYKKNEQQLREEIESLNFYRSKSPYLKSAGPADEEVIMKLNKITAKEDTVEESAAIDPFPVYPAQAEEQKTMPVYLKILLSIGILALMMGVVYVIKPDLFNALTGKSQAPAKKLSTSAPKPATITPPADDSLLKDSIEKSGASVSPADTLIKTMPAVQPADTATVYEIIGASMHDQKEADNFIALMKKSGIDAKVVTNMSGRRLKMSIATLKDEKTAKEELQRLSKKLKIEGIYIYRNKQK